MAPLIQFEHVTKRYGRHTVIDDLSFSVRESSVTALLGPNGAGKTTAMRLLLGIARVDGGRASLFGHAAGDPEFRAALHRCGALIEEPALYANASARDNLRIHAAGLGISRGDPRIDRMLDSVGLSARASDRVKKLSLGMRQRLALALALLNDPQLVILDEPTNGLDPAGVVEMRELIRSLPARGTTVLISSHLLSEVQKTADDVVIIDRGRLVREATTAAIIAEPGADRFVVRVPDSERRAAAEALRAGGLSVEETADDGLLVTGDVRSGSRVSRLLAAAGVYPEELYPQQVDLEEAFLQITGKRGDGGAR